MRRSSRLQGAGRPRGPHEEIYTDLPLTTMLEKLRRSWVSIPSRRTFEVPGSACDPGHDDGAEDRGADVLRRAGLGGVLGRTGTPAKRLSGSAPVARTPPLSLAIRTSDRRISNLGLATISGLQPDGAP